MRLTDLADLLRGVGLAVVEVDGWQTRGRGGDGGQYRPGRPTHVMLHHTAGRAGASAASEVNYMTFVSGVAPIANLYVARNGDVWVMAAGPTNTNGRGEAPWSNGLVADNDMNRHAVGIEIGNNGIGEPYPQAQLRSALTTTATLVDHLNLPIEHVRAHHEYAPGRKIDPAGPSPYAAGPHGLWDMGRFRRDVALALPTSPPPLRGGDDMQPINPIRNSDTRLFGTTGLDPNVTHRLALNVPDETVAVALNVAAIPAGAPGYVSVWPDQQPDPGTSVINYEASGAHNGAIICGVVDQHINVKVSSRAHIIVDITAYWT